MIADDDFSIKKDDPSWPDADFSGDKITLTNGHGWCRLNNSGSFVDTVGWGTATTNETQNAGKPAQGESIERDPLKDGYAPCQDTDDNSVDFFVQETPTPKNSSSPEMDPVPVEIFDADDNLKGSFVKIQDAVGNASDGYTIRVDDGTYNENVDVDKQLTICSEHGAAFTTVSALDSNDHVIAVTTDYVTITGFNVVGATQQAGIYLCNANYCNLTNNSASNNKIGIHLQMGSQHNTITNNNVLDNEDGISLSSSDDNSIYNNYFSNTNNAIDNGNNIWNITKTPGTNIIGGPNLGGNYWCDYAGADTDNVDGLGDFLLPYNSGGNIQYGGDSHPLVPLGSAPILSIVKSDKPDPVQQGGTLNYTISVKNTGNATATNVNVTETYDANVTFVAAVPTPSSSDETWQFPTLNVSETRWINISVTVNSSVPNGTVLHNIVNVSCDEGVTDSDTANTTVFVAPALPPNITSFAPPSPVNDTVCNWRTFNVTVDQTVNVSWYLNNTLQPTNVSTKEANYTLHAEVVGEHNVSAIASNENGTDMQTWVWHVTVAPEPVLEINKTCVPDPVSPGGALNYTIRVNNAGNATAINVIVKETYDANVTFIAAEPAPSSGDDTWQFATLNASETKWINISVTVNSATPIGTVLHNSVNVICDEGVTDSDTVATTVLFKELNCTCGDICVNTTGWWRDGGAFNTSGTPIQAAIDNATAGDVICVNDGTYTENVDVNKRLTIRSENGAASTSVRAARDGYVFEVTADYVNISGFHVAGATKLTSGIYLYGANYCNIFDNIANDNSYHGIFLNSSSDNTLVNNSASDNSDYGISLSHSSNNNLIDNTASDNKGDGFKLESNSNHNRISGNNASDNGKNGICLYGTTGNPSSHNTVANNTVDLNAKSGIMIEGADSDHNTIVNNTCKSNDYGISVRYGDYNNLTKNTCNQNSEYGIKLYQSADNNEITNNTAISNTEYGIYIPSSDYNIIYNNYFNNTHNANDNGNNVWNTTKTLGTNIMGGPYLGGNYWSNYAGRDINGDGLGDTLLPYNSSGDITNDGDYHPLVPVGYAPVLSIVKSDNPDPVSPGGTLNYTIHVNNTGNATATNVTVMETYDKNVTFVAAVPKPSSGNETWQFPTLNVSETRWINVSVIVNASVLNGTVLHNIVNVSCAEGVTGSGTEATTVSAGYAAPEITYFDPSSPVNDTVDAWRTFNVTVNQTVNVSWYLDDDSPQQTNESVREASFNLTAVEGEHIVTANASNGNGSDSHSWVWHVKQPGISITKVSSVTEGVPSTNVNFTINVTNTGDCTLNPVKVVDTLPAGMSYVATGTSPAPSSVHGNTITWNNVGPLDPGASTMISLIAHIDTGAEGTLRNLVNATGKPPAGDNATDSDTAAVTVFEPDIVVISEVFYDESGTDINEFCELYNPTDSDIDIGGWTLNAFNEMGVLKTTTTFPGGAIITAHKFYLIGEKEPLNSSDWGGTAISPDCLRGGTDWQNGPDDYLVLKDRGGNYIDGVRWGHEDGNNPPPIPDVPDNNTAPGVTAGKSIERKPLDGGYAPCQDTDNNSFDFVVQDTPTPKNSSCPETGISVTKVCNVTEGVPSTNINFTINVTNTGDCTLNPVKVVDTLPAGMSYVATGTSPAPSSVHGNTITWNIVDPLNPDAFTIITLIAHIDTGAEGTLTNLVNATGKPLAGDNVTGSDTADVTVFEPDIVVISEVFYDESGTTDINEFCELYNPTNSDIDIGDWTLKAFNQDGALKTTTIFPDDANITAHKFYLIGEKNPLNSSDWGGTAISPDCLRGGSDDWQNGPDDYLVLEDSSGNYIDGVRWGHDDSNNPPPIPDVPDNNTAPDAAKGKSIERKPLDGGYAPCQDTDNNSFDFVVQDTPTPKNSSCPETGISVTKVGDVTVAAPSTLVYFNITVSNTGKCTLKHVLVEDTLPAGMSYVVTGTSPAPSIVHGNTITWNDVGPLAAGASKTIKLVAQIEEDAEGVLTNTVDVTGTPEIGTKVYASTTAQVSVIRVAIEKSCKSSTTSLGKTVKYTIKYSNPGEVDLTNVVIIENYPKNLTFISANPAPDSGTNNKWTIGTLPTGESGKITIKMKVPASVLDLSYTESGSVSGEGIVMISKELSTKVEPFDLENIVTISGSYKEIEVNATASAITTVSVSGSSLEIAEHGSGTYESEEELSVSPEKMGIKFDKTTNAEYSPTTFKCSDGFVMEVPSKWSQDICIKNYVKKSAIHKTITEATYMNDNTIIKSDNKGYSMDFDSSFLGYLHVDKKTTDAATSEHYIGKFVIKDWDQGGDETVEGVGYVIVDKELASGQLLLMEHGSGSYSSEEDSSSNRIYKTTYAEYEPTSFNFSDSFVVNFSSMWMQDFCTRNKKGTIALHKKIRDATYIDDDTKAKSSPSLKFDTFFYGATHVGSRSRYSRASEDYIGDFYVSWAAITDCTFVFEWGEVPGADEDELIMHLSEPRFGMPWVTDDDVEITKPVKDTIDIFTPEHSAEIILDTKTNETAELIVAGVEPYTFKVEKHGKKLKVFDCVLERKPEEVSGEGFVMVDEAIFSDGGEIQVTEHGSGIYYSHEDFNSKAIEKETYGEYKPTYFDFSDSFAVNFSSLWMQDICAKDKKEGTAIHKKISDASFMIDDTIAAKSLMNITSSFNGSMHIGARTENVSISEDYIGEFNVTERIKIVKGKPPKSSSESSDWLFCPCPIPSSTYPWFCQDPTYRGRWLSVCPYPYKDHWLYIHP